MANTFTLTSGGTVTFQPYWFLPLPVVAAVVVVVA